MIKVKRCIGLVKRLVISLNYDYVSAVSEMMKFTLYSFGDRMGKGAVEGFIGYMSRL